MFAAIGVLLGTFVGVLPGIGPALTIALLLPITFNFEEPTGAFIMFAGIYFGGMYGGSTTSILLNTPGESASVATAIEGYEMAKRGRAGPALATSAIGSFVAGTIGILLLTFLAEPVADLAVQLQPADYFALTVLAFVSVTALVGSSLTRGMLSLFLGLFIGLIGIDQVSGTSRLTFGVNELNNGVDIVLVAVGLFAVGEALYVASRLRHARRGRDPRRQGRQDALARGPAALVAAVAARHRARLPVRRDADRRRRDPDLPLLRDRAPARARQGEGGVRQGRDRGRRRAGGGQQRGLHRRAGAAADDRHPDLRHRRDPRRRVPDLRPPAGAAAVHQGARPRVGADRLAVRRQRDAARAEPAARAAVGEGARDPARAADGGDPRVRDARRLLRSPARSRSCSSCTSSACSASSCAASTSPSRR